MARRRHIPEQVIKKLREAELSALVLWLSVSGLEFSSAHQTLNVSSTKSSGVDAFSLAMKNSHVVTSLSCVLLLH